MRNLIITDYGPVNVSPEEALRWKIRTDLLASADMLRIIVPDTIHRSQVLFMADCERVARFNEERAYA